MFSVRLKDTSANNSNRQLGVACLMALVIALLIPIHSMASSQVTLSLSLSANSADRVEGYRIYYKNGSPGAPYNGSGLNLGNSPVEIPISSLSNASNTNRVMVIDDGDAGTSSTGNWPVSGGTEPYGAQSLYSREAGTEYTYASQVNGDHEVALWWSGWNSRCTNVPVEIHDGNILLDRVYVDQSKNNGQWNVLGSYDFSGDASVTVVSDSNECSTSADAVRFAATNEITFTGLTAGETYYFVATVYDSNGNESDKCGEVAYETPPAAPLIIGYHMTASATGQGTISPSGGTSVNEGDSLSYAISAAADHHIADVLIDGVSVGILSSYTFNQIHADHEIEAIFEADENTDPVDPGGSDPDDSGSDDGTNSNTDDIAIIIDDGEFGTSSDGEWKLSGGTDPYGMQSLFSKKIGDEYTYESKLTGRYEISLWWSGYKSRCSDVPVEIYDGQMLIDTISLDQSQDSGQWNSLGAFDFTDTARVVVASESSDCSTAADAIKFVEDDRLMIIDDGTAGTSSNGNWKNSGGTDPFGTSSLFSKEIGAEYIYQSKITGSYEVAMWWSGYETRCSNVPVEIYDGNELIDTINVDQSQNTGQWNVLGSYYFNGDANVYIVSDSNECSTSADALKFVTDDEPKVIDNDDNGTASTGLWYISGGTEPFGTESRYSKEVGAEYTYAAQVNGFHEVALWWSGYKSRCTNVPIEIYDGDILLDSVYVDQSENSGQWNVLGAYDFDGDAKIHILSDSNECSTSADAVRFIVDEKPKVIDDGDAATSSTGEWSVSGGTNPLGAKSLYSKEIGAEYTYKSQASGTYEIALWWSGYKSRCSDVPVEIYDDGMLLDRIHIDQSQGSGQWNTLGAYNFSGEAIVAIVSNSNECSTSADGLRLSK